jgi:hypothetical protein
MSRSGSRCARELPQESNVRSEILRAALLAPCVVLGGCYASNVVASADRAVASDALLAAVAWQPATGEQLVGFHESRSIEGDAALSLRKVYYVFVADGRYTGAALVDGEEGLGFQTLGGTWRLDAAGLSLDGGEPARCEAGGAFLRIQVAGGTIVMQPVEGS